ncbi:unnamed protein product, partial [Mesorhabditis spiculigera]
MQSTILQLGIIGALLRGVQLRKKSQQTTPAPVTLNPADWRNGTREFQGNIMHYYYNGDYAAAWIEMIPNLCEASSPPWDIDYNAQIYQLPYAREYYNIVVDARLTTNYLMASF